MSEQPNTISDEKWRQIQESAAKANPHLLSFTDPEAVKKRKLTAEQKRKANQN